jgi:hypothetical protein
MSGLWVEVEADEVAVVVEEDEVVVGVVVVVAGEVVAGEEGLEEGDSDVLVALKRLASTNEWKIYTFQVFTRAGPYY